MCNRAASWSIGVGIVLLALFSAYGTSAWGAPATPKAKPSVKGKAGVQKGAAGITLEYAAEQLEQLLSGVTEISTNGVPGPLCVYGPRAFPVVIDSKGERRMPTVAAAELDNGRLVALPHNGYFGDLLTQHAMTGRLVANCVAWTARRPGSELRGVKVAVSGYAPLRQVLRNAGAEVIDLPARNWMAQVADAQVVIIDLQSCSAEELQQIEAYVRRGGGIVAANLIWGWLQSHANADPTVDHPGNLLFSRAGIVWADGTAPTSSGGKIKTSTQPEEFTQVSWCLDAFDRVAAKQRSLSADELSRIAATLGSCYEAIPRDQDAGVLARLEEIVTKFARQIPIPSDKNPVALQQSEQRMLVGIQTQMLNHLPVDRLKPAQAAAVFPGTVSAKPNRTGQKVSIDLTRSRWHSTGLYALPGEHVTVKTDATTAQRGLSLQIGCHTDSLMDVKAAWSRMPEVVRRFPLNTTKVEIGHVFGGLIYVVVPEKVADYGKCTVEISGAIEAPYYVHGVTTRGQWNSSQKAPAPWAELETNNVILTVPSDFIRGLDFPDKLMTHWTQVLDACADLSTIPHERKHPERIVFDVQISAGFMHSGYPIMCPVKPSAPEAVNIDHLFTKGAWGFYHELGHNHQQGAWTFDGTVEVTCNLYSLYVLETLTPRAFKHQAIQLEEKREKERSYIAGGARFDKWKSDPFLALIMYQQLQEAFGWDAFKRVFAEYRDLPKDALPKNDAEKRDQWLVRFSRTVGKNLGPFFQHWGIPTSEAARRSIADLPTWMPGQGS